MHAHRTNMRRQNITEITAQPLARPIHVYLLRYTDKQYILYSHLQREVGELQYNSNDFWKSKFQMQERYPKLLLVIELCLVIPVQTSCCDRANSCLNRIMCDFRSTLDVVTVGVLMRIFLSGGLPEDYHSSLAAPRQLDSGERAKRPTFTD